MADKALYIYRASAGSGKTFTLAVEYIKLLVANPKAYKHILAVTFTNKATAEMKERIMSQLYGISYSLASSQGYFLKVKEAFSTMPEEELRSRAKKALHNILHDYGHFRIQTIDAFFQSILRSLAKELELSGDLEITLDSTKLLNDTVELLIKRMTPTSEEMGWIVEYIEEHLENDKSWKVREAIKEFAQNIIKEEYQQRGGELRKQIEQDNGALLADYRKTLRKVEQSILERTKRISDRFFSIAETNGLCVDDFAGKSRGGLWGHFSKMRAGEIPEIKGNSQMQKCIDTPSKISKSLSTEQCEEIRSLLCESKNIHENELYKLNSCRLSLARFHQLRLLNSIASTLREENNRENRFLLAQTTYLLSKMIDNDTSFIFEKIGTEINHIFIDEFQDTSKLQWSCFKVLLHEVMSRGTFNLIVGDVKQSIYRWRNSDWNILNNIEKEFPSAATAHYTNNGSKGTTNYRSERNIVEFNNALFKYAAQTISTSFDSQLGKRLHDLTKAYSDVEQQIPENKKPSGYAQICLIEKEDEDKEAATMRRLHYTLKELLEEKGVTAADITILVRRRKEIAPIVKMFNKEFPKHGITSDEAYRLSTSSALEILIGAMRYMINPDDKVRSMELAVLYQKEVHKRELPFSELMTQCNVNRYLPQEFIAEQSRLSEYPIYELIEKIIKIFSLDKIEGQEAYIYSFLDHATQYLNSKACDMRSFVAAWDEELMEKTIPSASNNCVKIITIHKAKGLEFHTVIIPFCTWDFTGRAGDIIWCNPRIEPFNGLSLLPINRSKQMLESVYCEEYNRELLFQLVDNLNLMYVACTRASHNLFIFADAKPRANSASSILFGAIGNIPLENVKYNTQKTILEYGNILPSSNKKESNKENPFLSLPQKITQPFVSHDNRLTSRQSHNLARFLAQGAENMEQYEYQAIGNLMHELMSKLSTGVEIHKELRRMQLEGLISTDNELSRIKKLIEKALQNPMAQEWFGGQCKLLNEHTILYNDSGEYSSCRPDRVMLMEDKAVVVDFKFGNPHPEHRAQVEKYMNLLTQMGYNNIKGYLWYIYKNKIEEIKA